MLKTKFNKTRFLSLLLCSFLFICNDSIAQVSDSGYTHLKSSGKIPKDILKSRSQKIKEVMKQVASEEKTGSKKKDKLKKLFNASSALTIDQILLSGNTYFNDEISNYLNSIKDELLKDNDSLRNVVKIYLLKSATANAFTLNDGKVFFNIGLLNYLKTEAEIAFVIAHEISHYTLKHSVKQFDYNVDNKLNQKMERKERFYDQNQFSQTQEKEADMKALDLIYNSKYSLKSSFETMETLELTEYNAFNYKFPRSWLANNNFSLSTWFELDSIKPIELANEDKIKKMIEASNKTVKEQLKEEKEKKKKEKVSRKEILQKSKKKEKDAMDENIAEEDDEDTHQNCFHSTHPESPVRKKILKDRLASDGKSLDQGLDFLVKSKEGFDSMQLKSKVEATRLLILANNYEAASYYAGGLMMIDSTNPYYRKLFAKSFGAYSLFSNKYWHYLHLRFNRTRGNYSDYLYMMYSMYKAEKSLILTSAFNFCYKEYKKYPDDQELKGICVAIANRLQKDYKIDKGFFKKIPNAELVINKTAKPKKEVYPKEKDVINKIKVKTKSKKNAVKVTSQDYVKNTLAEYESDKSFAEIFKTSDAYSKNRELMQKGTKYLKKLEKENDGQIKKLIVFSPYISKYNVKQLTPEIFEKIEKRSDEFNNQLVEVATLANLQVQILNPRYFKEKDIDGLNDAMRINEYLTNFTNNDDIYKPNLIDMVFMDELREKYQTDHLLLLGVKRFKSSMVLPIMFSLMGMPYFIPEMFIGGKGYYYYAIVINLSTGDVDYANEFALKMKDNRKVQKGLLYSFFNDIRHTKYKVEYLEK